MKTEPGSLVRIADTWASRTVSAVGSALQKPVGRLRSSPEFRDGLKALQQARWWIGQSGPRQTSILRPNGRSYFKALWDALSVAITSLEVEISKEED